MSVINDMLRDLEARKAPAGDGSVSSAQVEAMIEPRDNKPVLIGLTLVIALVIGVVSYVLLGDEAETTHLASASNEAPITEVENQTADGTVVDSDEQSTAPLAKQNSGNAPSTQRSKKQASAESATASPVASNKVKVADKPASTAKKPPQEKPIAPIATAPAKASASVAKPKPAPKPKPVAAQKKAPPPAKQISAKALDLNNAQAAQAYFTKGDDQAAYQQLNQFIETGKETLQSRIVLLTYLMRDQKLEEAGKLLTTLPVESDPALRQMKARWLVAMGQSEEAIVTLNSRLPLINDYPEYYALLASYYQQFGFTEKAIEFYTRLVEYDNQAANWWAGLGIALESAGLSRQALVAYKQAVSLPGLRPELMNFISGRIK